MLRNGQTDDGQVCYLQVEPVDVGRQAVVGDEQQMVGVELGGLVQQVAGGHVGQRAAHARGRAHAHAHAHAARARVAPAHAHAAADYHASVGSLHPQQYTSNHEKVI